MSPAPSAPFKRTTALPKVIDARGHGLIDYGHAAFFLSMAVVCRKKNPPAALAALLTGGLVLAESLLTDYPLGFKPLIPFASHGTMDAAFAAVSPFVPKVFGFEGSRAALVFKANALVETAVISVTDFDTHHARAERKAR